MYYVRCIMYGTNEGTADPCRPPASRAPWCSAAGLAGAARRSAPWESTLPARLSYLSVWVSVFFMYVCIWIYVCIYVYMRTYVYIYIYMRTYTS